MAAICLLTSAFIATSLLFTQMDVVGDADELILYCAGALSKYTPVKDLQLEDCKLYE